MKIDKINYSLIGIGLFFFIKICEETYEINAVFDCMKNATIMI